MHNFPQQKWSQYLEQLCSFCVNAPFFVKKIRENRYICPAQRAKQQISIYFWLFSFLIQSTAIKAIEQLLNKSLSWLTVVIPLAVGKVRQVAQTLQLDLPRKVIDLPDFIISAPCKFWEIMQQCQEWPRKSIPTSLSILMNIDLASTRPEISTFDGSLLVLFTEDYLLENRAGSQEV